MTWFEITYQLQSFLSSGGLALWCIIAVMFFIWWLVIARYLFIYFIFPRYRAEWLQAWEENRSLPHWHSQKIRELYLSQANIMLRQHLPLINIMVIICPLLGLLGTVNGMIEVFDTMEILGTGNPRAMATGISQATITTMAGMVVAVPGLFFYNQLQHRAEREHQRLFDQLT